MFMFLHANIHNCSVSYKKPDPSRCSLTPLSRICNDGQAHVCLSILNPCRYPPFRLRPVVRRPTIRSAVRYKRYAITAHSQRRSWAIRSHRGMGTQVHRRQRQERDRAILCTLERA